MAAAIRGRWRRRGEVWGWAAGGAALLALPTYFHNLSWLTIGLPYVTLVPWTLASVWDRYRAVSLWPLLPAAWGAVILQWRFIPLPVATGWAVQYLPFWLLVPWLLRRGARRFPALPLTLALPVLWVTGEWLRVTVITGKLALFLLGYSQAPLLNLIQVADLAGVYGVSFLVAAVNGAVADLILFAVRHRSLRILRDRRLTAALAGLATLLLFTYLYSLYRLRQQTFQEGPRIALIQPSLDHHFTNVLDLHLKQMMMSLEVPPGSADLVVWPENAIQDVIDKPGWYLEDLAWLGETVQARFLVGAYGAADFDQTRWTNSAWYLSEQGEVLGEHEKRYLIPFMEYIPFDPLFRLVHRDLPKYHRALVSQALGWVSAGVAGRGLHLFDLQEHRFGVVLCSEAAAPDLARRQVREGAEFLINLTSEGRLMPYLQRRLLAINALRAVEHRVAAIRAGNTGVSGFIDGNGRLQSVLKGRITGSPTNEEGVLVDRVMLDRRRGSLYTRAGDWLAYGCALTSLLWFGWTFRRPPGTAGP